MALAPVLAVSLRGLLDDVGTFAGIAAILGVAVLSLLYFAQAREVKRLRDWAGRSPERAQELEQRVSAQADESRRTAQEPAPAPTGEGGGTRAPETAAPAVAGAATRVGVAPHAPAGAELTTVQRGPAGAGSPPAAASMQGAPPLGSATPGPALLASAGGAAAAAAGVAAAAGTAGAPPAPVAPPEAAPAPQRAQPVAPAASTAAAATRVVPPPGRPAAAGNGRGEGPPPASRERRTVTIGDRREERLLPDDATIPPRRATGGGSAGEPARRRAILLVVAGLLLVAAIAFAVVELTSSSSDNGAGTTAAKAKAKSKQAAGRGGSFSRGAVTVAVLNGTPTAGLANQVATELVRRGFGRGAVTNAQDQQRSATVVSFVPGHRRDAVEVARALRIPAAVEPVDPDTRAVACPPPAPCKATVIVTVGSDRTG